jgi:quercetin dioxygenase-like cupin family protein
MIKKNYKKVARQKVEMEGAQNVYIRWLIGEGDNPPNFFMRLFEMKKGGHTPLHKHSWEHEVFVLDGEGELVLEDKSVKLKKGDVALVEPQELHQFRNSGKDNLQFLCLIPKQTK